MLTVSLKMLFFIIKNTYRVFPVNNEPPLTEHLTVHPEGSCKLTGLQAALHYEMGLIEEGRALLAQTTGACVKRRIEVVERIREFKAGKDSGLDPLALCEELKNISKRIEEIATEGEWLEMQGAKKKYALFMAEQKHVDVSF